MKECQIIYMNLIYNFSNFLKLGILHTYMMTFQMIGIFFKWLRIFFVVFIRFPRFASSWDIIKSMIRFQDSTGMDDLTNVYSPLCKIRENIGYCKIVISTPYYIKLLLIKTSYNTTVCCLSSNSHLLEFPKMGHDTTCLARGVLLEFDALVSYIARDGIRPMYFSQNSRRSWLINSLPSVAINYVFRNGKQHLNILKQLTLVFGVNCLGPKSVSDINP